MKNVVQLIPLLFGLFIGSALFAQQDYKVHFSHGTEIFPENFKSEITRSVPAADIVQGHFVRYVQFSALPTTQQRTEMEELGVNWVGYVNFGTYLMAFPEKFDLKKLAALSPRSIMTPQTRWKMHRNLVERPLGKWAVHRDLVDVVVQIYPQTTIEQGATFFEQQRITVLKKGNQNGSLTLRIPQEKIEVIAALPIIKWMELQPEPAQKDDINGRSLHRANLLDSDHPLGKKFNGTGVNVLVRDDGAVGPHIDFSGRLLNQDDTDAPLSGTHGDGVAGVIGAAGNLDPTKKGMAAGANIYVVDYVNDFQDATLPLHLNEHVTITNSSYSDGCNAGYTLATQTVDEQIFQHPNLMHVFSAGNSNGTDCDYGAGNQWGNITGGHKMAKNAIATANLRVDGVIETSSSRGPAFDGRLKPDISAHGTNQNSTDPNNTYQVFGGTSAAAPGIAGCLAQLTQAYKTIHDTAEVPSALLKLTLMTTANEMGNIGPDYIFGWGHINNFKALRLLETQRHAAGTVENGGTSTHTIAIPTQTKQAKMMIYWVDRPSDENTAKSLINDLDMIVTAPDGTIYRPWKLDPTPNVTILNTPAGTGRDSLNNMEQVAIENPVAGNYTVTIKGYEVPFGPQPYYIAWEFLNDRVQLTYPSGGEGFVPGTKEWLRWDAYGNTDPFSLRYSVDGGNTFTAFATNLVNTQRMFEWTVPNTVSGNVKIMLIRSNRRDTTDFPLTIAPLPTALTVSKVCPDSITLNWTKVANDTLAYHVYSLGEKYMEIKGLTAPAAQQYQLPINDATQESWHAIRSATASGVAGQRTLAVRWAGGLLGCPQQFDAALVGLVSPSGDAIVSCGASVKPVIVAVGNQGLSSLTDATISYTVNGQSPVTESLPTIAPGETIEYTFATPITLSQNGIINFSVTVNYAGDNFVSNNTRSQSFSVIAESANAPFNSGFETTPVIPVGWNIVNPDDLISWQQTSLPVTGSDGNPTTALSLNHFSYNPAGQQEDYLYVIPVDLSNMDFPLLNFDYAHAGYDATYTDAMRVEAFANCDLGGTPIVLWEKTDPEFAIKYQTSNYSPNAATDWTKVSLPLSQFVGQTIVVRFTSVNGFGNNTYLDNIGISNEPAILPIAQFIAPDTICRGDTITLAASPSPSANDVYIWSFGTNSQPSTATGAGPHTVVYTLPGTRTVRLIVNNGFGSDTLSQTLIVRSFPTAVFTQTLDGLTVNFNNTSANADSYLWDFGDSFTSTVKSPSHTYAAVGTYTVTLNTTNNCKTTVKTAAITLVSGTIEQTGLSTIKVLPNPNNGAFEVAISNTKEGVDTRLQLFDNVGRLITTQNPGIIGQGTTLVPFHGLQLPAGTYQLSIQTAKGSTTLSVVVQ